MECVCGKPGDNYHLLTCKTGGGPVWEHAEIVTEWNSCLQELKFIIRVVQHRYCGNKNRLDIVVSDSGAGSCSDIDIAFAHPWSEEALKGLTTKDGFVASTREKSKCSKHEKEIVHGSQTSPNSIPLGRWGNQRVNTSTLWPKDRETLRVRPPK